MGWVEPSITMVFLWAFTTRLGLSSFSFWRVSAQCWLVDEDCIFGPVPGRKRQGAAYCGGRHSREASSSGPWR